MRAGDVLYDFASGGLEPITAIGGSKNGFLRFLSFSALVKLTAHECARCNFGRTRRPKLRI